MVNMADMLVKLYDLDGRDTGKEELLKHDIVLRRVLASEKYVVTEWVKMHFGDHWSSECEVAISRQPVSCYIAVKDKEIMGFGCYDATCRNFFGPTGVLEKYRGLGVGKGLLLECLKSMYNDGYAYAIIGGVGPVEFYAKSAGAVLIEGSHPGIYKGML